MPIFTDTWTVAKERRNAEFNTFTGFNEPKKDGARIDWILSRGPVTANAIEIVTFSKDGQFPSDHFPVVAWLQFGQKTEPRN